MIGAWNEDVWKSVGWEAEEIDKTGLSTVWFQPRKIDNRCNYCHEAITGEFQWEEETVQCLCGSGEGIQLNTKDSDWVGTEETKCIRKACSHCYVSICAIKIKAFAGGLSEDLALGLCASDLIAGISATGIEFATDFTINQVYDYLKGNVTSLNTFFNLLPAFAGLNRITRGYPSYKIY